MLYILCYSKFVINYIHNYNRKKSGSNLNVHLKEETGLRYDGSFTKY